MKLSKDPSKQSSLDDFTCLPFIVILNAVKDLRTSSLLLLCLIRENPRPGLHLPNTLYHAVP